MAADVLGPSSSTTGLEGLAVMKAYTVFPLDVYLDAWKLKRFSYIKIFFLSFKQQRKKKVFKCIVKCIDTKRTVILLTKLVELHSQSGSSRV